MKSEKDKMLAGENYNAYDKTLSKERQTAKKLLHRLNVTEYMMNGNARQIIRQLLPHVDRKIYIEPPFHCDYGYHIYAGENVYFNCNCVLLDGAKISIGNNVFFGPSVHIYTSTHPTDIIERLKISFSKSISIGNDCWIGGNVTILPGVKIGNGCTIGAGSVVTKDIPDNSIALGNPATVIKKLK